MLINAKLLNVSEKLKTTSLTDKVYTVMWSPSAAKTNGLNHSPYGFKSHIVYYCLIDTLPNLCTCHRLPLGVGPRANQGNMSGNTKDGLDSLPLGRGKFARCFQIRRKGVGEYEIL